jgi:hypothetical protein
MAKKAAKKKQVRKTPATAKSAKKPIRKKPVKKGTALKKPAKKTVVKKAAKKKPVKKAAKAVRKQSPAQVTFTLDDITVIGGPLVLSTLQEVDQAESELGIKFPSGYREYVTRFGEGVLGGYYVRVYPPNRILSGENNLREWRDRINEYWFWDDGKHLLTKPRALESVIIGDTLDGDELVVHPNNPERIYVLPRNSETIYVAGDGLLPALQWLCSAGTLTEPFEQREFEPFDSRKPRVR